jgi:hypothetical protein
VPEAVLQRALLDRDLRACIDMLHRTPTADPKMRAAGRHPQGARAIDLLDFRDVETGLASHNPGTHRLAWQRPAHEHDLALVVGHTAGLQVE